MATDFVSYRTFLLRAEVSEDPVNRFSQSFHHMVSSLLNCRWSIRPSFSDILRDIAMATNFVAKLWQNYLPAALIALSFRNGIGYRFLNVHINSVNDVSILCENFFKFGPVTPELTELICNRQVWHVLKNGAFSQISPDILDRFSQSFHHVKVIYMQMMELYLIFQFFKGRCHDNHIMLRKCYQRRLIPLAFVALVPENELQYPWSSCAY